MTKPTKWLCAQRRLRSAWASAQSDQSLRCPHEESLSIKHTAKTLIRFAPSEDSDQPGHPPSLIRVFAVRMTKACPLSAQRRLWSDWADAQADLSLRLAHSHFVGFVMSRLISDADKIERLLDLLKKFYDDFHDEILRNLRKISSIQLKPCSWAMSFLRSYILTIISGVVTVETSL